MKTTVNASRHTANAAFRAAAPAVSPSADGVAAGKPFSLGRALLILAVLLLVGGIAPQLLAVSGFAGLVLLISQLP